jgi:hypothetical protein
MYISIYIHILTYTYIYIYIYIGPPQIKEEALFDGDMQLPENVLKTIQYMTSSIEASNIVLTPRINPYRRSFCITNSNANDNPIVFASPGMI